MDLRNYLFENRITAQAFAKLMDCSRQQIGLVIAGKYVSQKFARQIERVTNGQVKASEVVTKFVPLPQPETQPLKEEEGQAA